MRNIFILVFAMLFYGCGLITPKPLKDRWAKLEPNVKYSRDQEVLVWGHVLRGKDVALFYGTPVYKAAVAVKKNDIKALKAELKHLSVEELNQKEGKFGMTLTNFTVYVYSLDALQLLIEKGASPNIPAKDGDTAFYEAVWAASWRRDSRAMEYLIANGGDVNYNGGHRLLLDLLGGTDVKTVKMLVDAGANPHNKTVLERSIISDEIDIVNYYLFECGVDPNLLSHYTEGVGPWCILDDVNGMHFAAEDTASWRKKEELIVYLRGKGFKLREEQ